MNKLDIVKSAIVGSSHPDNASFYTDDFQATDSLRRPPIDKKAWFGMVPMMVASFPDFGFVIEELKEEGDDVRLAGHFVGTFINDLNLSAMGMGVISAHGKQVTWPTAHSLVTFESEKITRWHGLDTEPDGEVLRYLKAVVAT